MFSAMDWIKAFTYNFHLLLPKTVRGGCYDPHLVDEEAEAKMGKVACRLLA